MQRNIVRYKSIISFRPVCYVASRCVILRNTTALADRCPKPLSHGALGSTASNPYIPKQFFMKCVKSMFLVEYTEKIWSPSGLEPETF